KVMLSMRRVPSGMSGRREGLVSGGVAYIVLTVVQGESDLGGLPHHGLSLLDPGFHLGERLAERERVRFEDVKEEPAKARVESVLQSRGVRELELHVGDDHRERLREGGDRLR